MDLETDTQHLYSVSALAHNHTCSALNVVVTKGMDDTTFFSVNTSGL